MLDTAFFSTIVEQQGLFCKDVGLNSNEVIASPLYELIVSYINISVFVKKTVF